MADRYGNHPIEEEHIRAAIGEQVSEGRAEAVTLEEINEFLTEFQDYLQNHLHDEINFIHKNIDPTAVEHELGTGWYGNTYDYFLLELWSSDIDLAFENVFGKEHPVNQRDGLNEIILDAHARQFRELVEERNLKAYGTERDLDYSGISPVVIQKSYNVIAAQSMITRALRMAIEAGATPAEAVDYLMVENAYLRTASEWAETRDRSPQAVSQNINRAKEKLEKAYWND